MLNTTASNIGVVILAAGEGKRMKSDLPKVMHHLHGEPLVQHVVKAVEASGLTDQPVIIVNPKHTLVQDYLGNRARYAIQQEQLGTGHAVGASEPILKGNTDTLVVLYGDMPFISPASLQALVAKHQQDANTVTMMTVVVTDFSDWQAQFGDFGRIVRDSAGRMVKSVEKRDANAEELLIKEVNPCIYCFNAEWLWSHLHQIKNENAQKEYLLTDLVKMAIDEGAKLGTIAIDPKEAIGINTQEHLERAKNV